MKKTLLTNLANLLPAHSAAQATALVFGLALAGQAQAQTQVYQHWPLKASAQDSAAVRSAGVTASTPTLRRLVVSDGSALAAARPYSALYGQAIAPQAPGAGWGTAAGGPGGTLKRVYYEQFTVTAAAGQTVRADSVLVTAGFLTTDSNTNMAVVYSRSGFVSDSTDVTGGKGPAGTLPATNTGGFLTPVSLLRIPGNTVNNNNYRFALNGANGVTLTAGQTLTVRLYFSCSSTGTNSRFALVKDVIVKSRQAVVTAGRPLAAIKPLTAFPNPVQNELQLQHPATKAAGSVAVYSATGSRVAHFATQPNTSATVLPLSGLPQGIYLVEYSDGQQRLTSRIVKQ
ncbi:hypothetical protein GCM10027048_35230 [Hymenobacter coalescens]